MRAAAAVLLAFVALAAAAPTAWQTNNGNQYLYVNKRRTFADAEAHCVTLGAHLTSVHSTAENTFITSLLPTGNTYVWLGVYRVTPKTEDYAFSDSTPFSIDIEDFKGPNPKGNERVSANQNCFATTASAKVERGAWNDLSCTRRFPFICKIAAPTTVATTPAATTAEATTPAATTAVATTPAATTAEATTPAATTAEATTPAATTAEATTPAATTAEATTPAATTAEATTPAATTPAATTPAATTPAATTPAATTAEATTPAATTPAATTPAATTPAATTPAATTPAATTPAATTPAATTPAATTAAATTPAATTAAATTAPTTAPQFSYSGVVRPFDGLGFNSAPCNTCSGNPVQICNCYLANCVIGSVCCSLTQNFCVATNVWA